MIALDPTPDMIREHSVDRAIRELIEDGNAIEFEDAFRRIAQALLARKLFATVWRLYDDLGSELREHRKQAIERGEAA